jgi:peptide/nickel transport system permease protein
MWAYVLRKLLYNIPVYLGIVLLVMVALRVNDPVGAYLGKNPSPESIKALRTEMKLDRPFVVQYANFLFRVVTLDFSERSWEQKRPVGDMLRASVVPSLAITVPALVMTTLSAISIGLLVSYFRGRLTDRLLMFAAVIGMSISFLVYIILGQYFGAYWLREEQGVDLFAIQGYEPIFGDEGFRPGNWAYYCLLPVIISVIVAIGYDTRFYRAVMVEETGRDYIVTAMAKGASKPKVMFVHMLKNAMIPIITHVMITFPFLITGSILLETFFNIPGMGRTLITAIASKDFPVIQAFTAVFAAVFIASNILTDVLYALVDPRVRLS